MKNEIDADRTQIQKWIYKIDEKAHQIQDMADCILEYSLQKKTTEPASVKQEPFRTTFYDPLSETYTCLEQTGFQVETALSWEDRVVSSDPKYVVRIFDNIRSNIIKYASRESPVKISSFYENGCCGFLFENARQTGSPACGSESTGIGVRNVQSMMEEMGGSCEVEETEERYQIRLIFAC